MATQFCQKCKQVHPGHVCDYDHKGECTEIVDVDEPQKPASEESAGEDDNNFRHPAPPDLQTALETCCEKFKESKQTVLFRRGESAFGMFLVFEGKVSLDFEVDGSNPLNTSYGPGALVGLPATLTGHNYSMTATVTEEAEVGFISMRALQDLLRSRPELCQPLLTILSARVAQTDRIRKAMLAKENIPEYKVGLA